MKANQKAFKLIEKLLEAEYINERAVSGMTVEQMLALRGVSVSDIAMINELQKHIKAREVIGFFCDGQPKEREPEPAENSDPRGQYYSQS